ncbi:MAG: HAMP domain-containing histidine kinase [Symploca sp. SIO2C1]|nr:HAMP domain-containing histidine kinase [Symploca sp. SIO2C1]
MTTILPFLLGLSLGLGFYFWQQHRHQQQLEKILGVLHKDTSNVALNIISRLRRGVALVNQRQEQLENELEIWQQLLQVAPLGYLQVDEENQLLWCNERARQVLQIDRWEPGRLRLLLELVRSYELDQLIEATRRQQQSMEEEWVFHPSFTNGDAIGKLHSLTLRAYSWPLPERQVGVFVENRQPLVNITQSRNQWVSDLAHELRTPLTSIRLVAEALQKRLEPPATGWVEQMLRENERLINLVQDWLELTQMEKDPSTILTYQNLELRPLIESVWQTLEPLAQSRQLNLVYSESEPMYLRADQTRLTQVFLNLLDNSIKRSPPQAAIRVEVTRLEAADKVSDEISAQSVLQIDVIDSGSGFSEIDLPHVFERFYRGDASRRRQQSASDGEAVTRGQGSGLGLSIVQQIIQAHGGTIEGRNHPETGGAWLQIILPEGE